MARSKSNASGSGSKTRRKSPILDHYDITPWANTVRKWDGRTITLPYFLSTLPKSWLSASVGKNGSVSLTRLRSIMLEHRISLNIRQRNLQDRLAIRTTRVNPNSALAAVTHHWVRRSLKDLSPTTKKKLVNASSPKEAISRDPIDLTVEYIRSEIGRSRKRGKN